MVTIMYFRNIWSTKLNSVNVKLMVIGKYLLIAQKKNASLTGCRYNIFYTYTNILHKYINYKCKYV